jgi:hypothetical protein
VWHVWRMWRVRQLVNPPPPLNSAVANTIAREPIMFNWAPPLRWATARPPWWALII